MHIEIIFLILVSNLRLPYRLMDRTKEMLATTTKAQVCLIVVPGDVSLINISIISITTATNLTDKCAGVSERDMRQTRT